MSGYSGDSGESNGLDSLFASLRQQQSRPISLEPSYGYYNNNNNYYGQLPPEQFPPNYQQPSVSSAVPTPPARGPQPHHPSAAMSPVSSPQLRIPPANGAPSNTDRTSSLLNLLKFSQPSAPAASSPKLPAPIGTPLPLSREPSASFQADPMGQSSSRSRGDSELLANLMGNIQPKVEQRPSPSLQSASKSPPFSTSIAETAPPSDTKDFLLSLLNQPKPSQFSDAQQSASRTILTPPSKQSSGDDIADLTQSLEDAPLEMSLMGSAAAENLLGKNAASKTEKVAQPMFTYVNPFEQLAASSPRIRTPKESAPGPSTASPAQPAFKILKRENGDNKRKNDGTNPTSVSPAHSKRKIDEKKLDAQSLSSGPPTPLPDGRSRVEALIGIGAPGHKETVSSALDGVGSQVDKEVQEAIAQAEKEQSQATIEKDFEAMLAAKTEEEFEESAQLAAKDIKRELEKEANSGVLDTLPTSVAEAVKEIIDETAQAHIADSWESADAEDSPVKEEEDTAVKVFNFPMRPWSSIIIKESNEPRPIFRPDVTMDIARLKKDFDQIDRTLVTSSNNFIVYGMSKNGGIRIIRQEDGRDARLFTETHDRIFSVATSSSLHSQTESVIGTGVSGTVYWAMLKDGQVDNTEEENLEMHGFALPPILTQDAESPGGLLKTRARKSAGHPEFFAVGRGKYIHIIRPSVVMKSYLKNGKGRTVDTEKYFNEHSLKVNTAKAGKDFTFSEDDSTIVSLDKAGRVKFWDIRPLTKTDEYGKPVNTGQPIEIKDPIVTYTTTPVTEKSWPTSVMFVDKLRPYQKGGALRYLIVGMKQNHTLQLWDLALGRPVQEIHLPHGKESDAVCSVMYHAATGMVVVGHPTRNSIYFIHLSAPKYHLPRSITQADYMQKLAANDPSVSKPDNTAVMSGMREYSFANKGHLRSLDILQTPSSSSSAAAAVAAGEPATLFELYAMHSKGVTCLSIKQAKLGWNLDNKVIRPIAAEEAGMITMEILKEIPAVPTPDISDSAQTSLPVRIASRPASKEIAQTPKKASNGESSSAAAGKNDDKAEKYANGGSTSAAEKLEKKSKRSSRKQTLSSDTSTPASNQTAHQSKPIVLDPASHSRNTKGINPIHEVNTTPMQGSSQLEERISSEIKKMFGDSLDTLYSSIKVDRRVDAAKADSQQQAILHLVSQTLSENIEATLSRIVTTSIEKSVVPAISTIAAKAINEQLGSKLNSHLSNSIPKELHKAIPDAVGKALQHPQLLKLMSDSLAKSVAFKVEEQFATILQTVVTPAFSQLAVQTSQRVSADIQRQAKDQIDSLERKSHADSMRIEQLMQLVTGLSETVSSMASAQTEFQAEFLRLQQQHSEKHEARSVTVGSTALAAPAVVEKTPQQLEYDAVVGAISADINAADYPNAVLRWLRSGLHQEVFEGLLSDYSPNFLRELNPIYLIALGSVVSDRLDGPFMHNRLAWLDAILTILQSRITAGEVDDDEDVRANVSTIVGTYIQRLEHLFMILTNTQPQDPILKRISLMSSSASRIVREASGTPSPQAYFPRSSISNTSRRL